MDLYVFPAATTSRAVLAFCAAEKLSPTIHHVDLMRGEHHQPPFAAKNPNRMVPFLDDEGFQLGEAAAILRYLADKTRSSLYPRDLEKRARVDELMSWFEANLYKDFGFQFVYPQAFPHHTRGSDEANAATVRWGRTQTERWLTVLDQHYLSHGDSHLVGGALTIADLFGISIVSLGELVGFSLADYPRVARWYEATSREPSWSAINGAFSGYVASLASKRSEART